MEPLQGEAHFEGTVLATEGVNIGQIVTDLQVESAQ